MPASGKGPCSSELTRRTPPPPPVPPPPPPPRGPDAPPSPLPPGERTRRVLAEEPLRLGASLRSPSEHHGNLEDRIPALHPDPHLVAGRRGLDPSQQRFGVVGRLVGEGQDDVTGPEARRLGRRVLGHRTHVDTGLERELFQGVARILARLETEEAPPARPLLRPVEGLGQRIGDGSNGPGRATRAHERRDEDERGKDRAARVGLGHRAGQNTRNPAGELQRLRRETDQAEIRSRSRAWGQGIQRLKLRSSALKPASE